VIYLDLKSILKTLARWGVGGECTITSKTGGSAMKLRILLLFVLIAGSILLTTTWLVLAQTTISTERNAHTSTISRKAENLEFVGQIGGPAEAVASQGNYAFVVTGPLLVILDISDHSNPVRVSSHEITNGHGRDVAIAGDYAYIAAGAAGLRIFDISDVTHPIEVGYYETWSTAQEVTAMDDVVYLTGSSSYLHIIDVSDPTSPTLESTYSPSILDNIQDVAVKASSGQVYAYVGYSNRLYILDVTMPTALQNLANILQRPRL
jgi:hypothetical protein